MLFLIIRDSIILFLLIYAILDLSHHILQKMIQMFSFPAKDKSFYVVNIKGWSACQVECNVRATACKHLGPVLIITENTDDEIAKVLSILCRKFENLHILSENEFINLITNAEAPAVFSKSESAASLYLNK